jgi:hypothetical protein
MAEVTFAKDRYAQVELNRCSFLHDGNIESQCVAAEDLENGMIVAIDKKNGIVVKAGTTGTVTVNGKEVTIGEDLVYGLNYTTEKIYNQFTPGRKNFYVAAGEYPRVGILKTGDIFTTDAAVADVGNLKFLKVDENTDMADGTAAVKYQVL